MSGLYAYLEAVRTRWQQPDRVGTEPPWDLARLSLEMTSARYHRQPDLHLQARLLVESLFEHDEGAATMYLQTWGFEPTCTHTAGQIHHLPRSPTTSMQSIPPFECTAGRPSDPCRWTLRPRRFWTITWAPQQDTNTPAPPSRWGINDAMWSLLEVFRNADDVVIGAMYGPLLPEAPPPGPHPDFLEDLLEDHPSVSATDLHMLYDPYTCTTPANCIGPRGHHCKLRDHVGLPRNLRPLLEALEIDTDLFSNSILRNSASPTINRWFSKIATDRAAGSCGNALALPNWQNMRALLFPPVCTSSFLAQIGRRVDKALRAKPDTTMFALFGPIDIGYPNDQQYTQRTMLVSHQRPLFYPPDTHLETPRRTSPGVPGTTWALWLLHPPIAPPSPPPWIALLAAAKQWPGSHIGPELGRAAITAQRNREAAIAQAEITRRENFTATVEAAIATIHATSSVGDRREHMRRLRSILQAELDERPTSAPRDDVYDLASAHLEHEAPARPMRPGTYLPGDYATDDDSTSWMQFFANCDPPFLVHLRHPQQRLLNSYKGTDATWVVLAHDPWDHLTRIYNVTRSDEGGAYTVRGPPWLEFDTVTVVITVPLDHPAPGTTVIYDVGASDFALLLDTTAHQSGDKDPGDSTGQYRAVFHLLSWSRALLHHQPPTAFMPPTSRTTDINTAILGKWSARVPSAPVEPAHAPHSGAPRRASSVRIPEDETLPRVSAAMPSSQILQQRLAAPIKTATDRRLFASTVDRQLLIQPSSRLAAIHASEELAPRVPANGPRKRKKCHESNPHDQRVQRLTHLVEALRSTRLFSQRDRGNLTQLQASYLETGNSNDARLLSADPDTWGSQDRARILQIALTSLTQEQTAQQLWIAHHVSSKRIALQEQAEKTWTSNPSAAYKEMTRLPEQASTDPLEELVATVRIQGQRNQLCPNMQGGTLHVYRPSPETQWQPSDLLTDWQSRLTTAAPGDPSPHPHLAPLPLPDDFAASWRETLNIPEFFAWLGTARPPLPTSVTPCRPRLPDRAIDYNTMTTRLTETFHQSFEDSDGSWSERNAYVWKVTDADICSELSLTDLTFAGVAPDALVITDGSGADLATEAPGAGGFAALVITTNTVTVVLGFSMHTTAGQMEMAAVLEGLRVATTDNVTPHIIGSLSDYETWIKAKVDKHRASSAAGLTYPHMWETLIGELATWGLQGSSAHPHQLHRHHTKAHVDAAGDWAQNLNQLCDHLAHLAKVTLKNMTTDLPPRQWHCPASTTTLAPEEVGRYLSGPITVGEWEHAISTRDSNAKDTEGLYYALYRAAGDAFRDTTLQEYNRGLFQGKVPTYRSDGTTLSTHRALAKSSGGNRHLGAPDSAMGIFASIISTRLIQATAQTGAVDRAQKCNMPRVAGCQENIHLFMACLYDIHVGAAHGKYREGKVRLFFLNDLSKAFDRAQHPVILRALQTLMGAACTTRFLALIDDMHQTARIVVSQQGVSVIVDKMAGVIQGNPNSPPEFGTIMELVRWLIPPDQRPKVKLLTSSGHWELRIEIDYADDEQRVTDSIEDMQTCIGGLLQALETVNLQWNATKLGVLALRVNIDRSVSCFDPLLTVPGPDGTPVPIKAIRDFEPFTLYGVDINHLGQANLNKIESREREVCNNIAASHFPIPAKLSALRMVNSKKGEFLAFNVWNDPDLLTVLDKLEMAAVRSYLKLNLPNAYIMAELHLSSRCWRQEVLYLASFVRRLGSKDSRVKLTALMMSRDAQQPHVLGTGAELLTPRFFGWTGAFPDNYTGPPHSGAAGIPERIAHLAHKFQVGLWEDGTNIHVTFRGDAVQNPHRLLQTLSRRRDKEILKLLEGRQSTNRRKQRAPPFSISWGTAGRVTTQRKEERAFIDARSPYSDAEIRILTSLRLLLWPTAFRDAIRSSAQIPGKCPTCHGTAQTPTHLLNIPASDRSHAAALRNLPQDRHTKAVRALVKTLAGSTWKIIVAEGHRRDPDAALDAHLTAIRRACAQRELDSGDGAQHYKPDAILLDPDTGDIYIVDVHFGSDDKLEWEDALYNHLRSTFHTSATTGAYASTTAYASPAEAAMAIRNGTHTHLAAFTTTHFDLEGAMTAAGQSACQVSSIDNEDVSAADILKITSFSQARYARRYAPLVGILRRSDRTGRRRSNRKVHLLILAVGVAGTMPRFTTRNISTLFPKKSEAKQTRMDLRHCAWRGAVSIYPAWRAEEAQHRQ
jgi:hypothetical protein